MEKHKKINIRGDAKDFMKGVLANKRITQEAISFFRNHKMKDVESQIASILIEKAFASTGDIKKYELHAQFKIAKDFSDTNLFTKKVFNDLIEKGSDKENYSNMKKMTFKSYCVQEIRNCLRQAYEKYSLELIRDHEVRRARGLN